MMVTGQSVELFGNIATTLAENERSAPYDKMAAGYDRLVGNATYNRLVWGCPRSAYLTAARNFLAQVMIGPIIDFGCGSCIFTAEAYDGHEDRLTLFDRSLGMLERAAKRLPKGRLLQGDALEAPFAENSFSGAMGWGMSHVFGTKARYLSELHRIIEAGGVASISSLTLSDRSIGNLMLKMLEKQGEAIPESSQQVTDAFSHYFDIAERKQVGSMLFLTGRKRA